MPTVLATSVNHSTDAAAGADAGTGVVAVPEGVEPPQAAVNTSAARPRVHLKVDPTRVTPG
jgi:hypothetical protein